MGAVITGVAINTKVLQRQNFKKEPNGLETIIEAYSIKTENRDSLVPSRNTLHSTFSSASIKYSRMVVESADTEEQDGGITQLLVTYVGLTSSTGLPPAIVRLIPQTGSGYYGPPLVIEAEFVTDSSETQMMAGQVSLNNPANQAGYDYGAGAIVGAKRAKMPQFINGTKMPDDPRPPYENWEGNAYAKYSGYVYASMAAEKRGLFLVARHTFEELFETLATVG